MTSLLAEMAAASRERVAAAKAVMPASALRDRWLAIPPPRPMRTDAFIVMAEIKRISPSVGRLEAPGALSLADRADAYVRAGAAAISVLTEPSRFGGSLEDLALVARRTTTPVMRKDFLVDSYQVLEARAAGASGVLLITRMLSDGTLDELLCEAGAHGLFVLLESFDGADLDRSNAALERCAADTRHSTRPPVLLGLNARDLVTLDIKARVFDDMIGRFPAGSIPIAESGIESSDEVARLAALGYRGALVGSALMRSADPERLCREMVAAGRVRNAVP